MADFKRSSGRGAPRGRGGPSRGRSRDPISKSRGDTFEEHQSNGGSRGGRGGFSGRRDSGRSSRSDFEFLNATLKVYPNPLTKDNHLNVKFATIITAKIQIFDVTGKLAITDEIDNVKSKQINTSVLTNGVYFLRLFTDNTSITRKVIIMK